MEKLPIITTGELIYRLAAAKKFDAVQTFSTKPALGLYANLDSTATSAQTGLAVGQVEFHLTHLDGVAYLNNLSKLTYYIQSLNPYLQAKYLKERPLKLTVLPLQIALWTSIQEHEWTIAQLSLRTNISNELLDSYLKFRSVPRADKARTLANALAIDIKELRDTGFDRMCHGIYDKGPLSPKSLAQTYGQTAFYHSALANALGVASR